MPKSNISYDLGRKNQALGYINEALVCMSQGMG